MSRVAQTRPSSLGAARPLPPSADIGLYLFAVTEASCVLAREEHRVDASDFMGCPLVQAMRMMKFTLREGPVTALNGFVSSVHRSHRRW